MKQKVIIALVAVALLVYFLYDPVKDRFFMDTTLYVSEAPGNRPEHEERIHLGTDLMDLTFSPYGGRIVSVQLNNFRTRDNQPVELISVLLKTRAGIRVEIPTLPADLDDGLYRYTVEGDGIVFVQETSDGLEIRKTYHPAPHYGLDFKVRIKNSGNQTMDFPKGCRIIPFYGIRAEDADASKHLRAAWMKNPEDKIFREKSKKIKDPVNSEDPVAWVGLQNRYFTQILAPVDHKSPVILRPLGHDKVYASLSTPPFTLKPGQMSEDAYVLYMGPIIEKELSFHQAGLEKIVDYGTFAFLGKGILAFLSWIHGYVTNYGLCLILLAVIVRLLLLPLTQYNLKSLREMPRILQEIYDIEEEEKDHPERAEERIHPLRKKQVRSMIGSFLPFAIQIPVFLALYEVLDTSMDLRKAAFIFWIKDLSLQDPLFLLPIFMGLAMILQQRLTSASPSSDKTWIWIPVGFALCFSFFPAGLVLFWLTDTLLSVGQLFWISLRSKVV
ncbi:MAG: membrane protein insertase YidC [bacterium]